MIHELKIYPEYFGGVINGKKTFEVRKNDRDFKVGDLLALNEYDGQNYTGNSCLVYVDYILGRTEMVKEGYVIMSIKPCVVCKSTSPYRYDACNIDYTVPLATEREQKNI